MKTYLLRAAALLALAASVFAGPLLSSGSLPIQADQDLKTVDYRIGPNDLLDIKVYELPDLNQTSRVAEDGSITLSFLGRVEVAGFTAHGLEEKLAGILTEKYVPGGAHVTVFIKEYQKISVIGGVGQPGMYEMVGPMTLLQAIAQAGGLTAQATAVIYVYRQGSDGKQTVISIDRDELSSGNQGVNIELNPKDVISVPIDQTLNAFVYGEVKNPGVVPYQRSKGITLLQAIAQAGGPTEWAKKSKVVVKRKDKKTGNEIKIRVNLKSMLAGKISDIALEEGDVVIVP